MYKVWMIRAYFEDYNSSYWRIIGLFTDKKVAEDICKKWQSFYNENYNILDKPKDWHPDKDDDDWRWSDDYFKLSNEYADIKNYQNIEIEEFPLNSDMSLTYEINENLKRLMTKWDRNHKLEKITK